MVGMSQLLLIFAWSLNQRHLLKLATNDLEGKFALRESSSVDDDLAKLKNELSGSSKVMPAVVSVMQNEAILVTLVKPQFEARRSQVGGGGIVRDPLVHQEVLERIIKGVENFGFCSKGWIESPLKGAEGNIEFLVYFQRTVKVEDKLD